jgi:hypothetical protein
MNGAGRAGPRPSKGGAGPASQHVAEIDKSGALRNQP